MVNPAVITLHFLQNSADSRNYGEFIFCFLEAVVDFD